MAVSIASLVRQCLELFKQLSSYEDSNFQDLVNDELGRFRIWAGNVSAHTTGRRSLEYRLRDSSELSSAVMRFLQELIEVLESGITYMGRREYSRAANFATAESLARKSPDSGLNESLGHDFEQDEDDDDDSLFADEDFDDAINGAPYSQLFTEVNEIITCLLQISMSLRNPARSDQIRYADVVSTKHFEPKDIEHVRMKFPGAADSVVTRLGKAASRHRQYFKYREEHHQKLAEGILDDDDKTVYERASTVATSPAQQPSIVAARPTFEDSDTESIVTATSYAETQSGDSGLRPPPMPEAAEHGPFECPLCYYIITIADERSWRQHVYEDFPPFVCTNTDCKAVSRQFSRRRDWRQHMKEHERHWVCPYGCKPGHTSPEVCHPLRSLTTNTINYLQDFQAHLRKAHPNHVENVSIAALVDSCAHLNTTASTRHCPLCFQQKPNFSTWLKHVGHHLEQLALFAIPQHLRGESSDDDADDSDVDMDELAEADSGSLSAFDDVSDAPESGAETAENKPETKPASQSARISTSPTASSAGENQGAVSGVLASFSCEICSDKGIDRTYQRKSDLTKHLRIHENKPFKCSHCEHRELFKHHLERHVQENHFEERPFKCLVPECDQHKEEPGYGFKRKDYLKRHLRTAHGLGEDGKALPPEQLARRSRSGATNDVTDGSQRQ